MHVWAVARRAYRQFQVCTSGPAAHLADDCIADGAVVDKLGRGCRLILENKLVSPLKGDGSPCNPRIHPHIRSAFAGSVPRMRSSIADKYAGHLGRHRKVDLIHEIFGGVAPTGVKLLDQASGVSGGRSARPRPGWRRPRPPQSLTTHLMPSSIQRLNPETLPWAARSFTAHTLQAISIFIHSNVAEQVFTYAAGARLASRLAAHYGCSRGLLSPFEIRASFSPFVCGCSE